jgi:hypothetical protein
MKKALFAVLLALSAPVFAGNVTVIYAKPGEPITVKLATEDDQNARAVSQRLMQENIDNGPLEFNSFDFNRNETVYGGPQLSTVRQ